ncbi:MAG: FAD binding domain-containing protein [Phycisphaerae bacterium]|nr:FAD binding domain-containing protein [Phycisphaerae bacterium]
MHVYTPTSLDEALELLANAARPLTPIAGGTDLLVSWHQQAKDDLDLLDISHLREQLQHIRMTEEYLELGALTTFWDVLRSPKIAAEFPLLAEAARQVGAVQIQTRGTWAGNIGNASPAADGVPVLMAYDAMVLLQSRGGWNAVPLHQYYTGYKQARRQPEQLIVAIRVPRREREYEWFHKVGARRAQAITKVGVAVVKDTQGWRVVANSVAPVVCRCRALEQALDNNTTFQNPKQIRQLLEADISPIDDIRSTAKYRATVLSRLLYYWLRGARKCIAPGI